MFSPSVRTFTSFLLASVVLFAAADADAQRRRRRRRGPAEGRLIVMVPEPLHGSEILVDEESVGFAPIEALTLPVGSHTVRVRRPGFTEFDDVVEIQRGEDSEMLVDMMALAMVLTVRSIPDEARVFVDGTFRGTTPLELELIDGEHSLRVTAPRYRESVATVTAVPGQMDLREFELEAIPESELQPRAIEWYEEPVTWILIGGGLAVVAAVSIALAVVLGANVYDDHCGAAPERDQCLFVIEAADIGWQFPME